VSKVAGESVPGDMFYNRILLLCLCRHRPPGDPAFSLLAKFPSDVDACAPPQAAVYLARSNRVPARRLLPRTLLSPARRLARTTISLGPEAGIIFGLRALR